MKNTEFTVVGHRGWPERYPENTLVGLVETAKANAPCVELDVQMSRDGIPVVFHDADLSRVTLEHGKVWDFDFSALVRKSAHEPERFGQKFFPTPISGLQEVCEVLAQYGVDVFVEIKEESKAAFSPQTIVDAVLEACASLGPRAIIISFDYPILCCLPAHLKKGWVLRELDSEVHGKALDLAPDVLAYNVKKLRDPNELWRGEWEWFLYDIVDPDIAKYWAGKGVRYIETWDVAALS